MPTRPAWYDGGMDIDPHRYSMRTDVASQYTKNPGKPRKGGSDYSGAAQAVVDISQKGFFACLGLIGVMFAIMFWLTKPGRD